MEEVGDEENFLILSDWLGPLVLFPVNSMVWGILFGLVGGDQVPSRLLSSLLIFFNDAWQLGLCMWALSLYGHGDELYMWGLVVSTVVVGFGGWQFW